jgi:hypothetical protein
VIPDFTVILSSSACDFAVTLGATWPIVKALDEPVSRCLSRRSAAPGPFERIQRDPSPKPARSDYREPAGTDKTERNREKPRHFS